MYSNLAAIGTTLADDLVDDERRTLIDYHLNKITAVMDDHPDLPPSLEAAAGFLHGFLAAGRCLSQQELELIGDSMSPTMGGLYLYAVEVAGRPPLAGDASPFLHRLTTTMRDEPVAAALSSHRRRNAVTVVRDMFATTPDLPMGANSLAGFVMGLLYATPFLAAGHAEYQVALMVAVDQLHRSQLA